MAGIILVEAAACASAPDTPSAAPSATPTPPTADAGSARAASSFLREVLDDRVTRAHALDVADDGRVFFVEREGAIKVWNPADRRTRMVGFIPVHAVHTSGLLGIALDPGFLENGWVYFYYSPYNNTENLLARYTIRDGTLVPESRQVILKVPVERQVEGGHSAGYLYFGPDGNLFLSIGDNTSPRGHGFGPLDEREGREIYDAQRSSGNTWDLRGKILRIRPREDGGYDIPAGNLFPHGTLGRPEIYVMGTRNPYRIAVDPVTGWLYWGDVGPDAGADDAARGPAGYDEFNQARRPGNFGWPYFVADNQAYRDFDFEKEASGAVFDPRRPVNESPNNTGARILPSAQPAMIWYPYPPSPVFPSLGTGGRAAMAGPLYRYPERPGSGALPQAFDGSLFVFDFMRNWIQEVRFDDRGDMASVTPFLEEMEFVRPMAMDVGPDGALYLIEWGESYEGWNNDDARLVRISYAGPDRGDDETVGDDQGKEPIRRADMAEGLAGELRFSWPLEGGVVDFDHPIPYVVERASGVAGEEVRVAAVLGHDSHAHRQEMVMGDTGSLAIAADETHLYMEDHFAALEACPAEEEGDPAARVRLQPRRLQAEHAYSLSGPTRRVEGSLRFRVDVTVQLRVKNGDHARYGPVDLRNIEAVTIAAKGDAGGEVQLRIDDPTGPLLARAAIPSAPADTTSSEPGWTEVRVPMADPGGPHELYLVFVGAPEETLMDVDWIQFEGPGMMRAP